MQARFDVAETLAVGQLGERHGEALIPAGQVFQVAITRIAVDALLELLVREGTRLLGKRLYAQHAFGALLLFLLQNACIALKLNRLHLHAKSFPDSSGVP